MMKKAFFMLAMLTCILASCSDGGSEDPANPTPTPEEVKAEISIDSSITTNGLSFGVASGEQTVSFSVNTNWTLSVASTTSGATWCKASATSGSKGTATVKFTVEENTGYDDRSVSVTIKAGSVSKTFTITQKGVEALLVTTNKFEVAQEGGKIEVEVKANISYELAISETAKDWITESKSKSRALTTYKHTFEVAANEEAEKREGEITFKSGDKVETVKVYQAGGAILLLSKNEFTVSDTGETISVDIKSNVEYGVQMPDVDWITDENSSRGMSSHTLKYVIAANEDYDSRSAEIIFYDKNSDLKDTLKVVQAQKDAIVISQKTYEVEAEGETIEVKLSANVDFEVTMPEVDWIEQVESRGLKEHTLYFKIAKNNGGKSRLAKIVFTDKDYQLSETLTVKQLSEYGYFKFKDQHNTFGTVELYQAGTLEKTLKSSSEDISHMIKLDVTGPINGDDIYFLRRVLLGKELGNVGELNLSDALIVEGGGDYVSGNQEEEKIKYRTSNNIIGTDMFAELANLTGITLPKNAISIRDYAFGGSTQLTYVSMGDELATIGNGAFSGCTNLRRVNIGNGVTWIGEDAFRDCAISSIVIPDNVTSMGHGVFYECDALKTVTIGNGVTSIKSCMFYNCKAMNSITIGNNVKHIDEYAFYNCSSFTSIDIPDGVTFIDNNAFEGCSSLTSINIPNGITSIDFQTFSGCSALVSIDIPNSITKIDQYAFEGCSSLTSINIPESVTSIESVAFKGCSSLSSITIGSGVNSIGSGAFKGCENLASVYITDLSAWCKIDFEGANSTGGVYEGSNPLYKGAKLYLNNEELTELIIPEDITEIKCGTFYGCSSLTSVTIGDNVTELGWYTFSNCI